MEPINRNAKPKTFVVPQKQTVARILRNDATLAHSVALETAYRGMMLMCQTAHWNATDSKGKGLGWAAVGIRLVFGNLKAVEWWARVSTPAVLRLYDEERDYGHMDAEFRSHMSLDARIPLGVTDIANAGALVAASLLGLIEPEDDYAAIIAEWYRVMIREEWNRPLIQPAWQISGDKARADLLGAIVRPVSRRAWLMENEAQWPEPSEFRMKLDRIKANQEE